MPDIHYTDPRLARLYDQDSGWGADSKFYLSLAGPAPKRILDLGCGTGTLCNAYAAQGHAVTGVDPAPAMLDVARTKSNAAQITWVNASAQSFHTTQQFDLIVMTGHAFQVLIDDRDIAATLKAMRDHLAPGGTIAFETRNPDIDWPRRWHGLIRDHFLNGQTIRQTYEVLATSADRITFASHYDFPDARLTSTSTLRFLTSDKVASLCLAAGLQPKAFFGNWENGPFDPASSDEMIFLFSH
jgi:2-polyprenyl-3-methyl-5-hydroxy-6-metoxy-1,4-benzoquinol methylase